MSGKRVKRYSPLNNIVFASLFQGMDSAPAMLEFLNAILAEVGFQEKI